MQRALSQTSLANRPQAKVISCISCHQHVDDNFTLVLRSNLNVYHESRSARFHDVQSSVGSENSLHLMQCAYLLLLLLCSIVGALPDHMFSILKCHVKIPRDFYADSLPLRVADRTSTPLLG